MNPIPNFDALYFSGAEFADELQQCDAYSPCGDCCRCCRERRACGRCLSCRVEGSLATYQTVGA